MKSIKKLAAQASLAVLAATAITGTASAVTISGADVNGVAVGKSGVPFASEVTLSDNKTAGADDGDLSFEFEVKSGTFPSGNVLATITLNNAVFNADMDASAFDFTGCSAAPNAVISSGGAKGSSTVTYVVSNLNGCAPTETATINVPFDLVAHAASSATFGITTEGKSPVDGDPVSIPITESKAAFSTVIKADGTPPQADVLATGGAYRNFVGGGKTQSLGTLAVLVDDTVYVDLGTSTKAAVANVSKVDVTVTGDYAGFLKADGGDVTLDGTSLTVKGNTATASYTPGDFVTVASAPAPEAISVTASGKSAINASSYSLSAAVDLKTGFTDPSAAAGSLDPITRNGTSATIPWTASGTLSASSGSTTFVRVSNPTSSTFGQITAEVLSSTNAAAVGKRATLAASLGAGAEALFTSTDLETALGADFGRGDILITVEGNGAYVTRLLARPDGTLEINNR